MPPKVVLAIVPPLNSIQILQSACQFLQKTKKKGKENVHIDHVKSKIDLGRKKKKVQTNKYIETEMVV